MSAEELVTAVRHNDVRRILQLSFRVDSETRAGDDPTDVNVNGMVRVIGPHGSLYPTHALYEASLRGNQEIISALLKRDDLDVNLPATHEEITCLAEACRRGDLKMVDMLLKDSRTDHQAGSRHLHLPVQYAIVSNHLDIVKKFAEYDCLDFSSKPLLMATCEENGMTEIEQWLQNYYLSKCSLKDLSPEDQVKKIWQEFCKFDFDGSNSIDKSELRILASSLGTPLSEPELAEAQIALDTNGDGCVDFEELVTFWLADDEIEYNSGGATPSKYGGIDPNVMTAVQELAATGSLSASSSTFGLKGEA